MKKISKYFTLIEEGGVPAALFNSMTHVLYFNWVRRPDYGNLPVNSFIELSTDRFYDKLENITK